MTVQSIENISKGRYRIRLEDGRRFVLYRAELSRLGIRENEEISDDILNEILTAILPKRAKLRGLNLLKARPYTEYQMRQKYIDGEYPQAVIDEAIEYLKSYHYIDDYEYCNTFIMYKSASRSRRRIVNDLLLKGIDKSVIYAAMDDMEHTGDLTDENDLILRLLNKRHYCSETASFDEKQKMIAFLYSKGFEMDNIKSHV